MSSSRPTDDFMETRKTTSHPRQYHEPEKFLSSTCMGILVLLLLKAEHKHGMRNASAVQTQRLVS